MPTPMPTAATKLRQLAERSERVFASYPLVARYFPAAAIEDARQRLTRTIERGDGPGLVIGAPGAGKSLLLQVIATQFHERFDVVLLAAARFCTRRALLQAILFELGLPYKLRDEGDLRLSLLDHLLSNDCPAGLLLLVDEAQTLPVALLDELRILTNLVRGSVPRVRLVLAGSAALEESFAHPELESFSQRLSARCYLAAFNRDETSQYIWAQISATGVSPDDILAPDAVAAIFDATDGVPRLVNQLCDRALQFAAAKSAAQIGRPAIQEAWADLQQLPTPWETPAAAEVAVELQAVEFGSLNDGIGGPLAIHGGDLSDTDDTELDAEDQIGFPLSLEEGQGEGKQALKSAAPHPLTQEDGIDHPLCSTSRACADPFAEKFDEEEVVLDNFAAWDDMFRRETPRVENRRDPGFSTLVQAAIDASPVAATKFSVPADAPESGPRTDSLPVRPRLRLADVPDNSSDIPHDALAPVPVIHTDSLAGVLAAFSVDKQTNQGVAAEPPVIVVEDDSRQTSSASPVRREDYRNLFSRLRSG
jgi:type II secretory pathway predicted ATPase ExeA